MAGHPIGTEITISKGSYSVTVYPTEINDNFTNKLFTFTPAQSKANQSSGSKDSKIVDLLRVLQQIVITGRILTKAVKEDLKSIYTGGGVDGGAVTLTYDGDSYEGLLEKVNFTERPQDGPTTNNTDQARYIVAITFIIGVPF